MSRKAVRLTVRGRVQGVGYRWWVMRHAEALGLDGWVRNLDSGEVEILAIGEPGALERLAEACRGGPSLARVAGLESAHARDDGSRGFTARSAS